MGKTWRHWYGLVAVVVAWWWWLWTEATRNLSSHHHWGVCHSVSIYLILTNFIPIVSIWSRTSNVTLLMESLFTKPFLSTVITCVSEDMMPNLALSLKRRRWSSSALSRIKFSFTTSWAGSWDGSTTESTLHSSRTINLTRRCTFYQTNSGLNTIKTSMMQSNSLSAPWHMGCWTLTRSLQQFKATSLVKLMPKQKLPLTLITNSFTMRSHSI